MNAIPTSSSSWRPTPRMMLADRQTEENLWLALAEQKDEVCAGLEHCLDVSYNCGPGYNLDRVQPSRSEKVGRGLFWVAGTSIPVSLAALGTGHEMVALGFIFTAMSSMLGGMVVSSSGEHPPSEQTWRSDTLREIQSLRQEAANLRQQATKVHQESADLRLACGNASAKATIDLGEQNVTLGGVRLKRKAQA